IPDSPWGPDCSGLRYSCPADSDDTALCANTSPLLGLKPPGYVSKHSATSPTVQPDRGPPDEPPSLRTLISPREFNVLRLLRAAVVGTTASRAQGATRPSAEADCARRARRHHHARIQQRADDDHQLRQDGPAP